MREGVRRILEAQQGLQVVGEASDGASALALAERLRPDVAVVDVGLPDMSGLDLVRRLRAGTEPPVVLVLSMYDDAEYAREARVAGAAAYVVKDSAATMLAAQLWLAVGGTVRPSRDDAIPRASAQERIALLTPRECDVLRGIARGRTNKEMGQELGISPRTVETHRERLMRKLGVTTVAGLTALALDAGVVTRDAG